MKALRFLALVALLTFTVAGSSMKQAFAEDEVKTGGWYGPYALGADVALAAAGVGLIEGHSNYAALPLVGLVFSGPFVHAHYGKPSSVGLSFLLRAGLPVTLGIVGWRQAEGCGDCDGLPEGKVEGLVTGAAIGLALGVVLDWTLVPHREVLRDKPRRKKQTQATVVPLVSASEHGALFGAAATF